MKDILLDDDWDIDISESADITLVDSPMQEIMIRLQWFAGEWIFGKQYGIPYFEHIFVKNPNHQHIKNLIKAEIMKVEAVKAVDDIDITVNNILRQASISFSVLIGDEAFRKEVTLHG